MSGSDLFSLFLAGYQWGIMEHTPYPHYVSQAPININTEVQYVNPNLNQNSYEQKHPVNASPPQLLQKRKRSINPQADENFVRALEAVRFGGIGFCKAARMYGVNNRTLWLEYKKRGYPISRLSIKNRKQEFATTQPQQPSTPPINCVQEEVLAPNPVSMLSGAFLDGRPVEIAPLLQRSRFFDTGINAQTVNLQAMNFETI